MSCYSLRFAPLMCYDKVMWIQVGYCRQSAHPDWVLMILIVVDLIDQSQLQKNNWLTKKLDFKRCNAQSFNLVVVYSIFTYVRLCAQHAEFDRLPYFICFHYPSYRMFTFSFWICILIKFRLAQIYYMIYGFWYFKTFCTQYPNN